MEITTGNKISTSEEELISLLIRQKIIKHRFSIPLAKEDAFKLLRCAYVAQVKSRNATFIPTKSLLENISKTADFLIDGNGKFGLLFCGTCGNGKTTLAKAIADAVAYTSKMNLYGTRTRMPMYTAREITDIAKHDADLFEEFKRLPLLSIDELGTEPLEIMIYGNVTNPVADVLERRYSRQLFTIATTNLNTNEMCEKYGNRLADRFREMFSVLVFEDATFRK